MNEAVVMSDMQESMSWVERAKDVIGMLIPGWRVMAVEGRQDEICRILDVNCGVDYLLYSEKSSLVFGVASRVQYNKNYRTFTVRRARESGAVTEYDKRRTALAVNSIAPFYSMQMYIEDKKISGLAITRTDDLIKFIEAGRAEVKKTLSDKIGQANFYICRWDAMRDFGCTVLEYKGDEAA